MDFDPLSNKIIAAAIEFHRNLGGPGLLESVYEEALVQELRLNRINVVRQASCPIRYKGMLLSTPLRIDLLVENEIIVECKATTQNNPVFHSQCLTYLRLSGKKIGLILNFGLSLLRDGIERVVN